MAAKIIHRVAGAVSTVGAATEVMALTPIPTGCAFFAAGRLIGRDTTSGAIVAAQKFTGGKDVAGVKSLVGSVLDSIAPQADASLVTASATFGINGSNLELRATGVVGRTIEWFGELTIYIN